MKIALTGKARSGKDTLANQLLEINPKLKTDAFASRLKLFAQALFDKTNSEHWYGSLKEIKQHFFITPESMNSASIVHKKFYNPVGCTFHDTFYTLRDYYRDRWFECEYVQLLNTSPRELLQVLGTECLRSQNANVHIDAMFVGESPNIITDVRFDNEAISCKNNGYLVVEVTRGDKPEVREHPSEAGIDSSLVDVYINNNGTLEDLKQQVKELYEKVCN